MIKKNEKRFAEVAGYLGMVLIHSATLPPTIKVILGKATVLPPIEMVLLVWTGLFLFLIRAVANNDRLYTISNAIGFFFNSVLLALIVFGSK
jgi:uncharacterized protein with PQ loop repeat